MFDKYYIKYYHKCCKVLKGGVNMKSKDKVKGYRIMLGLTQKEVASKLNISISSYINKETGRTAFKDNEKLLFKEMLTPYFSNITLEEIFF